MRRDAKALRHNLDPIAGAFESSESISPVAISDLICLFSLMMKGLEEAFNDTFWMVCHPDRINLHSNKSRVVTKGLLMVVESMAFDLPILARCIHLC
jgi:hypothetical protein